MVRFQQSCVHSFLLSEQALRCEGRECGASPIRTIGEKEGVREEGRVERGPNRDVCSVSSLYGQEVN